MITILEKAAMDYETGKMMDHDSEIEIDVFEDDDEPGIYVSDYSKSRGNADPVKKICDIGEIANKDIIALCNEHGWAYCL